MPQKKPFITLAQAKEIAADIPTCLLYTSDAADE